MLFKSGPPRYGAWGANGRFGSDSEEVRPESVGPLLSHERTDHRLTRLAAQANSGHLRAPRLFPPARQ